MKIRVKTLEKLIADAPEDQKGEYTEGSWGKHCGNVYSARILEEGMFQGHYQLLSEAGKDVGILLLHECDVIEE